MKAIILGFLMLAMTAFSMQSCTKEPGFNGNRTLTGTTTYPDGPAAGALVKIKFDATQPTTEADYTTVADQSGKYSFHELAPGDYVVWATYTSPEGLQYSTPGAKVTLEKSKGEAKADLTLN
ncbi:MAG: carboxypeptidase-like regulatory domain-containing protein [Bacteroidia bacterium]